MPTSEHTQALHNLESLFASPSTWAQYNNWITGKEQLDYIAENMLSDEVILLASGPRVHIDTMIANRSLAEAFLNNQLPWDNITYQYISSHFAFDPLLIDMLSLSSDYIRRIASPYGSPLPPTVDSFCSDLLGVTWSDRRSAYCVASKSKSTCDIAISVTERNSRQEISLVTCRRSALMRLLSKYDSEMKTDSVLFRNFDFHLIDEGRTGYNETNADSRQDNIATQVTSSYTPTTLVYKRQHTRWRGGYVRGVQVLPK